jgi:Tol biopolymer transport system component
MARFAFSTSATVPSPRYEMTQLTTSGIAVSPAISPDGKYVAYVQAQQKGDAKTSSIWIRQLATPSNQPIVTPDAGVVVFGPTVTPDGNYVNFLRGGMQTRSVSWNVPLIGGTETRLIDDIGSLVGFSPDGQRIAFVRTRVGQSTELIVANADGSGEHTLATRVEPLVFVTFSQTSQPIARPAWSPDSRVIALFELDTRRLGSRVVFIDVASGKPPVIRDSGGAPGAQGLAWLDSKSLVLSQPKTYGQPVQLWRMSYPGGDVSPLTNDLNSYVGVDIDADKRTSLVTSHRETRVSIWVSDEHGGDSVQIVPPMLSARSTVQLQVAGARVFYDAQVNGRVSVMAVPLSGGAPEELVSKAYTPSVTSSGDAIVFARSDGSGLWKVAAATRQPVSLVPDALSALVTPDDKHVVFLSTRSGQQAPWVVPIEGGRPVQIVDMFASSIGLDISPDGNRLMFRSRNEKQEPRLVVCDLPSCAGRRDLDVPPNSAAGPQALHWARGGNGVAYVDSSGKNIWAMPLDGGESQQITHFGDDAPDGEIMNFGWSKDGQHLAIARMTTSNDIVLLRLKR